MGKRESDERRQEKIVVEVPFDIKITCLDWFDGRRSAMCIVGHGGEQQELTRNTLRRLRLEAESQAEHIHLKNNSEGERRRLEQLQQWASLQLEIVEAGERLERAARRAMLVQLWSGLSKEEAADVLHRHVLEIVESWLTAEVDPRRPAGEGEA